MLFTMLFKIDTVLYESLSLLTYNIYCMSNICFECSHTISSVQRIIIESEKLIFQFR